MATPPNSTFLTRLAVLKRLTPLIKKAGPGVWEYINGMTTDRQVANLTGYTVRQITGCRKVNFGPLKALPPIEPAPATATTTAGAKVPFVRIPDIIARLQNVEKALNDLEPRLAGIATRLEAYLDDRNPEQQLRLKLPAEAATLPKANGHFPHD